MPANMGTLTVELTADTQEFVRGVSTATDKISRFADVVSQLAVGNILSKLTRGLLDTAKAFSEADKEAQKFNLTLANTNQVDASGPLQALAEALQKVSTFDDDELIAAQTSMLSIGNAAQDVASIMPSVVNAASFLGKEVSDVARSVGTAIESGATKPLRELGIVFDTNSSKVFKNASELERTKMLMQEMGKFAGAASAELQNADGAFQRLTNAMGNVEETMGKIINQPLADVFNVFSMAANGFRKAISLIPESIQSVIGRLVVFGAIAGGLSASFGILNTVFPLFKTALIAILSPLKTLISFMGTLVLRMLPFVGTIAAIAAGVIAVVGAVGAAKIAIDKLRGIERKAKSENPLVDSFKEGAGVIGNTFDPMIKKVKESFGTLKEGFGDFFGDVTEDIKEIQDSLKDQPRIKDKAFNVGTQRGGGSFKPPDTGDANVKMVAATQRNTLPNALKDLENVFDKTNTSAFGTVLSDISGEFSSMKLVMRDTLEPAKLEKPFGGFGEKFAEKNASVMRESLADLANSLENAIADLGEAVAKPAFADTASGQITAGVLSAAASAGGQQKPPPPKGATLTPEEREKAQGPQAPLASSALSAAGPALMKGDFMGAAIGAGTALLAHSQKLGELMAALEPAFAAIVNLIDAILAPFVEVFQIVGEILAEVIGVIMELVAPVFEALGMVLKPLMQAIEPLIKIFVQIFKVFKSLSFASLIMKGVAMALGSIFKMLGKVYRFIYNLIRGVWNWIAKTLNSVLKIFGIKLPLMKSLDGLKESTDRAAKSTEKMAEATRLASQNLPTLFRRVDYYVRSYGSSGDEARTTPLDYRSGILKPPSGGKIREEIKDEQGEGTGRFVETSKINIENVVVQTADPAAFTKALQAQVNRSALIAGQSTYAPNRGAR